MKLFVIILYKKLYLLYKRKIFNQLEHHLESRLITVITGMRRVGKTTAVKYLLEKISHDNKVFIDLEKIENRHIFYPSRYDEIQVELEILGIDFSKPSVIALDEVQLVSEITSILKYFYDHFPIKFIITGSSSFYLKDRFSESLAGRKRIFEMFPLDFEEFLHFKDVDHSSLKKFAFQTFQPGIYRLFKDYYEEYLSFGGFPEVVLSAEADDKIAYLKDIINAYIELDIKLLSNFEASHDLYRLVRLLATGVGSPLEYTRLSNILGIHRHKVKQYLELLERTYFVISVAPFTRSVTKELSLRRKIYLADTGLLGQLANPSSGQLFENAIAAQLQKIGTLQYYQRKSGQEIDFILKEERAFEVKETPTPSDLSTVERRATSVGIKEAAVIGRFPPASGFNGFIWGGTVV